MYWIQSLSVIMRGRIIVLITIGLELLAFTCRSQIRNSADTVSSMSYSYTGHSPLDYIQSLRMNFRTEDGLNYFVVVQSPQDWVREEHIPRLLEMIYSPDSVKSIMSVYSSYLTNDKFSSVGREAQNLIECFRKNKVIQFHPIRMGHLTKLKERNWRLGGVDTGSRKSNCRR